MTLTRITLLLALGGVLATASADQEGLSYNLAPYDLAKANWTASNYLQALLNPKLEAVCFAHNRFGDDAAIGGLYFIDDQGRVIHAWAVEAEYSPVVRLEAIATAARGIMRAKIPGTRGSYFFVIDGRQSIYLRPTEQGLGAYWLQDYSSPFARLELSVKAGDQWQEVKMNPEARNPEVFDQETSYQTKTDLATLRTTSYASVLGLPPVLELTPATRRDVRLEVIPHTDMQFTWPGRHERISIKDELNLRPKRPYVILEQDDHLVKSEKTGWEDPAIWWQHTSMIVSSFDPVPDVIRVVRRPATAKIGGVQAFTSGIEKEEVRLICEWRDVEKINFRITPFLELDPTDREYVFDAAERISQGKTMGFEPYFPVRTSRGFNGALAGLASAAWVLQKYNHPEAQQVTTAALEAFAAVVDAEGRGYFGERGYNATIAAYYLKRIVPEAFDYDHWVRIWADREFVRTPQGWITPPWTDTALRALCHWRYAWLVTGDEKYHTALLAGLAEFDLPEQRPIEGFMWRGEFHAFDGYDCTAAAHLIGEWGAQGDPRADILAREAGPKYFSDLGFVPYRTWTCDDLLPYHVGHVLPAIYGDQKFENKRIIGLNEYVGYDASGNVWDVEPPLKK